MSGQHPSRENADLTISRRLLEHTWCGQGQYVRFHKIIPIDFPLIVPTPPITPLAAPPFLQTCKCTCCGALAFVDHYLKQDTMYQRRPFKLYARVFTWKYSLHTEDYPHEDKDDINGNFFAFARFFFRSLPNLGCCRFREKIGLVAKLICNSHSYVVSSIGMSLMNNALYTALARIVLI